ncbi:Dolichyl-phosphate-mannose-protein mannosyltransferase [uncultured archaeon]|nr:Dolichyl-phosphate-mannose-protein mannosyltransferase [uncultured archaeon]
MKIIKKIIGSPGSNQIPLIIFSSSLFLFITFAGTRLFFSDEGVILNQFYNLINGSIALEFFKINTTKGVFIIVGDHLFGKFSYSLLILSLPIYYILGMMDLLFGAHLFILNVWALSGALVVYLLTKYRNFKHPLLCAAISYLILIATNLYFFKPIYFPMWGELLSIELTNILISSFLVLLVYLFFRDLFSTKIALFASFFLVFATPVSFYSVTLKHHTLSLFLTILAFYFFYKYQEKKNDTFMYLAYASAALCIWTRTLDGVVLLASLLIIDLAGDRRIKHIINISLIIIISLMPFFTFNYLILGHPFSIMETVPLTDRSIEVQTGKDFIIFDENLNKQKQAGLLNEFGFNWDTDVKTGWQDVLLDTMFLRTVNTFGVFLVSPFLIIALASVIEIIRKRIKLNIMDKILGLYLILVFAAYSLLNSLFNMNFIIYIIKDTPVVVEYRYLLIIYFILLYFALRIHKVKELIENNLDKIIILYGSILLISVIYFIEEFPIPFMNLYYQAALATLILLIIAVAFSIFAGNKSPDALSEKFTVLIIALSLAEASSLLLFYYWIVNMTYISPSQNYMIVPVLENLIKFMYQAIL